MIGSDCIEKVSFFIFSSMLMLTLNMPVFAEVPKDKVVFENKEIKDLEILIHRAEKGITDKRDIPIEDESRLIDNKTGKEIIVESFSTTQLLKVTQKSDGGTVKTYSTTVFAAPKSDKVLGDSKWDSSRGVKAYSTVYYNYSGSKNRYYDFVYASGGWKRDDTSIKLSGRKVTLGNNGVTKSGKYVSQTKTHKPSSSTWAYNTPSSFSSLNRANCTFGTNTYVKLTKGSSSWSLKQQTTVTGP